MCLNGKRSAGSDGDDQYMCLLQDFKYGRELARLMQEAGQHVPPELANCGPGFGGGRGGGSRYGPPGAQVRILVFDLSLYIKHIISECLLRLV